MGAITITFSKAGASITPSDLGEFLYLLRAAYGTLTEIIPANLHQERRLPTEQELVEWRERLRESPLTTLERSFDSNTDSNLLEIGPISYSSPLKMDFKSAVILPLVVAVVLGGGQLKGRVGDINFEVNLPHTLGESIGALREALAIRGIKTGFAFRETTITLTSNEYARLLEPDNGEGGFQSTMRRLKKRVDGTSRELKLTPHDLKQIYRHKCYPEKGGYQKRFHDIFNAHFPDNRCK